MIEDSEMSDAIVDFQQRWAIAERGGDPKGFVAMQKADILRLREEWKMIREWEHRDDQIAKLDHENTKLLV